jgi:hypothetical protein
MLLFCAFRAIPVGAVTIISVTGTSNGGDPLGDEPAGIVQQAAGISFTTKQSYTGVNIQVSLYPGSQGTAYLTNQTGAGTTSANIRAQTTFTVPSGQNPQVVTLFTGLTLPAGTWYLTLYRFGAQTTTNFLEWDFSNTPNIVTDSGVTQNSQYIAETPNAGLDPTFPPDSQFKSLSSGQLLYQITGTAAGSSALLPSTNAQVAACFRDPTAGSCNLGNSQQAVSNGVAAVSGSFGSTTANAQMGFDLKATASSGVLGASSSTTVNIVGSPAVASGYTEADFTEVMTVNFAPLTGQTGKMLINFDLNGNITKSGIENPFALVYIFVGPSLEQEYSTAFFNSNTGLFYVPKTFTFTYGQPFGIELSLVADSGTVTPAIVSSNGNWGINSTFAVGQGSGTASFFNTLVLSGLVVTDSSGNPVTGATFSSASGTRYGPNGVVANAILAPTSAAPGTGSGSAQVFNFTFADPKGWQDLGVVNVLLNNVLDGRHACYLAYSVSANTLYLVDDSGDAGGPFAGGGLLNTPGTIQNSQCTVNWGNAPVSGNGNDLMLTLNLSFTAGFAGNKVTYMAARDVGQNNSGWQGLGVWQVSGGTPTATTGVTGMNPSSGTGSGSTPFTFNFSDTKGFQDLGVVNILINSSIDGRHACYLAYSGLTNTLYLVDDAGDAGGPFAGGAVLNAPGSIQNSQCTVSWGTTPVNGVGNALALNLNIAFSLAFGGNRVFYLAARDRNDANNTDWQAMGTWTVQ